MPQRMDDSGMQIGAVAGGCAIVAIGAVFLLASLFLERADDNFYAVADNTLIGHGGVGPALVGLIVLASLFSVLSLTGPIWRFAPAALVLVSLACLVLTIVSCVDLGEHPTDMGYISNEIGGGSILSLVASGLMVCGSLVAFGGSSARK